VNVIFYSIEKNIFLIYSFIFLFFSLNFYKKILVIYKKYIFLHFCKIVSQTVLNQISRKLNKAGTASICRASFNDIAYN